MTSSLEISDDENGIDQVEVDEDHVLVFFSPLALKCIQRKTNGAIKDRYTTIGVRHNMCFKMIRSDSRLVKTILFSYGFLQCSSRNPNCNLLWTNTHVSALVLRSMKPWQRMNHFPRSFMITKKNTLYECIDRSMVQYGDWFNFIPEYFCTPLNQNKRDKLIQLLRETEMGSASPFIVKPACSSRGRDISFLRTASDLENLDRTSKLLISRYVDRPYLINNLKSDLRIYVLVTSFYPLIVYVYSDGLARFAVHEYNDENRYNYDDINTHLTNYSLNKNSADFVKNKDISGENIGHKWTLGAFLREMKKLGIDTELLMVRIEDIIIKTLLSAQGLVAASCRKFNLHPNCCFELFGFDILIDENLKPWLLEVNLSPSLACDAPLDSILKTHLLCDTLNIASIPLVRDRNTTNICFMTSDSEEVECGKTINSNEPKKEFDNNPSSSAHFDCTKPAEDVIKAMLNADSDSYQQSMANGDAQPNEVNSDIANGDRSVRRISGASYTNSTGSTRKRKIINARLSKVRRAKIGCKHTFSADSITPQYISRAACHFNKLETESLRQGRFIRIFPRSLSWELYGTILEDVGQERWDENLHQRINEGVELPEITRRDIETAHEQLINAKEFPNRENLNSFVRDVLLQEAFKSADRYAKRMYSGDIKPFPVMLPFVRPKARRRTQSQIDAEEVRRALLLNKRQQLLEQQKRAKSIERNTNAVGPDGDISQVDNPATSALNRASSCASLSSLTSSCTEIRNGDIISQPDNYLNLKEQTASETAMNEGRDLRVNGDDVMFGQLKNNFSDDGNLCVCGDDAIFYDNSMKKLTEVNANFIIRKTRSGATFITDEAVGAKKSF